MDNPKPSPTYDLTKRHTPHPRPVTVNPQNQSDYEFTFRIDGYTCLTQKWHTFTFELLAQINNSIETTTTLNFRQKLSLLTSQINHFQDDCKTLGSVPDTFLTLKEYLTNFIDQVCNYFNQGNLLRVDFNNLNFLLESLDVLTQLYGLDPKTLPKYISI